MLEGLQGVLQACGFLSSLTIDEAETLPSSSAYRTRFGSLLRAYQLVGFKPDRDYRYIEVNKRLVAATLQRSLFAHFANSGIRQHPKKWALTGHSRRAERKSAIQYGRQVFVLQGPVRDVLLMTIDAGQDAYKAPNPFPERSRRSGQ